MLNRSPPAGKEGMDGATSERRRSTLLVVDDDSALLRVLKKILVRRGYEVLVAGSAPEALELIDRHDGPLHGAICDLVLPGMGGWDLADLAQALRPGLPILFISGYDLPTVMEKEVIPPSMALEVTLLQKPFAVGDLTARLDTLLGECSEG